jgi:hypothetical protein
MIIFCDQYLNKLIVYVYFVHIRVGSHKKEIYNVTILTSIDVSDNIYNHKPYIRDNS